MSWVRKIRGRKSSQSSSSYSKLSKLVGDSLFGRRARNRIRSRANRGLRFETLEDRRLLAVDTSWANLGWELGGLIQQVTATSSPEPIAVEQLLANKSDHWYVQGDQLYVEVRGRGEFQPFLDAVAATGLQVRASLPGGLMHLAEGFIALTNIPALATLPQTISVLPVYRLPTTDSRGSASNLAEQTLGADVIRNLYGLDGTGVTVGVISDSANRVLAGLIDSIASGDLPPLNVGTFLDIDGPPGSTDEGRAMMELIHDIAPGAKLRFASGVGGEAAFATAVNTLVSNGANVIVDDLNALLIEPYFYDGTASQAITNAVQSGVTYFSSAGNRGAGGYESVFRPSIFIPFGPALHDFDPDADLDARQRVTLPAGQWTFVFQYDNVWGSVDTDLDFLISDGGGTVIAGGFDNNIFTQVAREIVTFTLSDATDVFVSVVDKNPSSSSAQRFKYIAISSGAQATINDFTDVDGAFVTAHNPGHNANELAISVAASNAATPTTPAAYSSVGPVTRVFDTAGNRLTEVQVLNKPDITSNDGVNTTVPGFGTFFGTSAAAPNAAALAALLLDFNPSLTPADIKTALQNGAKDIGTPGYDFKTGFGLINGFASVMQLTGGVLELRGDREVADQNDSFRLRHVLDSSGNQLVVELNGTELATVPLNLISQIRVNGGGGDDTLEVDAILLLIIDTHGDAIVFDGGTGNDQIIIGGDLDADSVHHTFVDATSGTIAVSAFGGAGRMSYANLEPITDNVNAADRVFTFTSPVSDASLTRVSATQTRIDSGASESVDFTTPTNSLTINLANGLNQLRVASLADDYNTPTNTINGNNGTDEISFFTTGSAGANWSVFGNDGVDFLFTTNLGSIQGQITFDGGSGTDLLTVDDSAGVARVWSISDTSISFDNTSYVQSYTGVEVVQLLQSDQGDTAILQSAASDVFYVVFGRGGDDFFNVPDATTIRGDVAFFGGDGNDRLSVAGDLSTSMRFFGGSDSLGSDGGRDSVELSGAGFATLSFNVFSGPGWRVDGFSGGGALDVLTAETIRLDSGGVTGVRVNGSTEDELFTVAPIFDPGFQGTLVFHNSPTDASGPFNGPPEDFFSRLPGIAGGGLLADLVFENISSIDAIDGGAGTNRLYVYGRSEANLVAPGTFDPFGFGPSVLLPGTPSANDRIFVSDTAVSFSYAGPPFFFSIPYSSFEQPAGSDTPAVVINSGFESNPPDLSDDADITDEIEVVLSNRLRFKVNGGDPDPDTTGVIPPDGDRLVVSTTGGQIDVWADKSRPQAVQIGGGGSLPLTLFTSIESISLPLFGGTLRLLGDNNDPNVDQPDHFQVIGRGFQSMEVRINGSVPIFADGVQRLLVFGDDAARTPSTANDVDTLEIRPYADNSPQGWGVTVFFDEGNPAQADDGPIDLLIYHTALFGGGVSEQIVIQPSGPENGEIRVTNAAFGTPIVTISYVANLDIEIIDDDGSLTDTDTLTLRGTASSTPQASGRELFDVDLSRAGTAADPMIVVSDLDPINPLAPLLYRVRRVDGIRHVTIESLDGADVIQVRPVAGASVFVDGGPPVGLGDVLNVITGGDTVLFVAGPLADEGSFQIGPIGGKKPLTFDNVEQLFVDTQPYVRPDSSESNNEIAEATILGSSPQVLLTKRTLHGTQGSLDPAGGTTTTDRDVYRITANQTGYLVVKLLFEHANGSINLRLDIVDGAGNIIASTDTATNNQLIIPVVSQQAYFVVVSSLDSRPTSYALELENFAAPRPTAIDLDDNFDTGRSNTDNVTRDTGRLIIHADLTDFDLAGIPILTAAQAAAGTTPGVAVEVFRNGQSIGFADPLFIPDLFEFSPSAAQLLGGVPTGSPVGPVAGNAYGFQNLFTAAVRVFDGQNPTRSGRTTATARLAVTYDPNAPDASLASMELLASSDSNVAGDLVTNVSQPAFWGIAEANTRVRLYASRNGGPLLLVGEGIVGSDQSDVRLAGRTIGGRLVQGLSNDGLGVWEITVEPLIDGTYSFTLTLEDLAGNTSPLDLAGPAPVIAGVVVDTLPPQRPTIDLLDADDTGRSRLDNVTIGGPTLGNGVVRVRVSAEPGSTVFVKDGEVVIATFVFNAAFDLTDGVTDGFGLLTIDFNANQGLFGIPAEGPHPLSAEAFDVAGNRSAQAEELLVTIDFTRPATPPPADLTADSDTGLFDNDNVTSINRLVVTGTGEANATVRVFARDVLTGTSQLVGIGLVQSDESDGVSGNNVGVWQLTLAPLADGVYDLEVEVEDQAGNISLRSAALRVEIDTTAPNLAFIDLVEADDTGRHNDDNVTRVTSPRFTLTTEDANATFHAVLIPGGENLRYRLFDRPEGGSEVLIYDSLVALGGLTPLSLVGTPGLPLGDGVHNLKLEVEDRAGNVSADFTLTVVIDTVAPPVNILGILSGDTGIDGYPATFTDLVTRNTEPVFVGRAEANAIVRLFVDGRTGVNNANGVIDNPAEFALTVALPTDGDDAQPNGRWSTRFIRDLNHATFFDFDGVREVLVTAEDVAGNVSGVQVLRVFVDTQAPVVTAVQITSAPAFDLFDPKPSQGPTPLVNQLSILVRDNPARSNLSGSFLYDAVFRQVAENPGLYEVRGDANGLMPIQRVEFFAVPAADGAPATGEIRLTFARPLPDDRFTLTISDLVRDPAGNKLDGETNTIGPLESPVFPSGDGQAGGPFVARFTVDSRPELGTWAAGTMWIDTNGNGKFDPDNPDFVNRDITYAFGFTTDNVFAGNFSPTPGSVADGFDKLAVFGRVGTTFRWLIDTDNDGAPDVTVIDATAPNGLPIAGNFDGNATNGDEVAIFDGVRWFFDTDHDFLVNDPGGSFVLTSTLRGYPVVGDFNGDGLDDLATWQDDTFFVDLAAGPGPLTWDGVPDFTFRFGFITTRDRPVVADMDQDGFADFGLWVPDRHTVGRIEEAEWYWLVSAGRPVTDRIRFDASLGRNVIDFTPNPLGPDLYFRLGQPYALPVVGNFDPPITQQSLLFKGFLSSNLFRPEDVDVNYRVNSVDGIHLVKHLARFGATLVTGPATFPPLLDVNIDGVISTLDLLQVLRFLSKNGAVAYGEGEWSRGVDAVFSQLVDVSDMQRKDPLLAPNSDEELLWLLATSR